MRKPLQSNRRDGAVLPLVTVCLVGLLGFVALAIDVGMMAVARTEAQSAADIAALAGARTLDGQSASNNKTAAEAMAVTAATSNSILSAQITSAQVTTATAGVYRYDTSTLRFKADFQNGPGAQEAYGAMRVKISTSQGTYFGRVLGVSSMTVGAEAAAVHRPRDVAISLDFSGSMRFSSEFNYPPITGTTLVTGSLSPDPNFPRFGPWVIYPVAVSGTPNPMQRVDAYIDSGGETHAANNLTTATTLGPPIVNNFQTTAVVGGPNAFVYNNDMSGASFNITNTPVCTPAPATWTSQYAANYQGDRWPLKWGNSSTSPAVTDYAKTAAEMLNISPVTTSSRNATWETSGYDYTSLTFRNGAFQGYSMAPGYFGKTFYMWPPDPRYTAGADPTNINTTNPVQDASGKNIADWRQRFFLAPSASSSTKGTPITDNSKLFNSTGVFNAQNLGSTLNYIPNYDAILAWLKNGPQTLPPALRAGRVCYYTSIPSSIPMNWSTGLISSSATLDQAFWKGYIDFVIGCGEHNRGQTLAGVGTNNTWGSSTFGTGKITPAASLTGTPKPYMAYDDCPVHPRFHMWFGPMTMMGFLSMNSQNLDYNWYAGTTYEAHCWQLKAGIQSALDDIKKNHPNDLATLNFWSSYNGYATPRVTMSRNYDTMKQCLFYPFSLVSSLSTVGSEERPYASSSASSSNPSGLNQSPSSILSDIPNANGGTCPTMGLMNAYNQFDWNGGFNGRKGATKLVILETDGVANEKCNATFSAISGGGGTYQFTGISDGGSAGNPANGNPAAIDPAVTLAWTIGQDGTGSKPWPTFSPYTAITGLSATTPTRYTGWSLPSNPHGFSTTRSPAYVHTLAFGYLFEPTTTSQLKTRALEFLRNIQLATGIPPDSSTGTIESYKMIVGTYDQRIDAIRQAMQRIMQGGIQVALVE
jgi:Flp pilus assembly protein TadG